MRVVYTVERKLVLMEGAFEEMKIAGKMSRLDDQMLACLVEQGDDGSVYPLDAQKLSAQQRQQLATVHGGADVPEQIGTPA